MPLRPSQDYRNYISRKSPPSTAATMLIARLLLASLWITVVIAHALTDDGTTRWLWLGLGVLWLGSAAWSAWRYRRGRRST